MKTNKNFNIRNILFLFIIIIFFSIKLDFVKNTYFLLSQNFTDRINKVYGFCSDESIGYLLYIKEKYKIKNKPKIVNYVHVPLNDWAIINTQNINKKSGEIIFLNYPGSKIKIYLDKKRDNIFEFKDVQFYSNKFKSISNLKIKSEESLNKDIFVEIYTLSKSLVKTNLKKISLKNKRDLGINLSFEDIDLNEKRLLFKFHNLTKNVDISLILDNKYDLNSYEIINGFENCYYVK